MQICAQRSSAAALHCNTEACLARLSIHTESHVSGSAAVPDSPSSVNLGDSEDAPMHGMHEPAPAHPKPHASSPAWAGVCTPPATAQDREEGAQGQVGLYLHATPTVWIAGEHLKKPENCVVGGAEHAQAHAGHDARAGE